LYLWEIEIEDEAKSRVGAIKHTKLEDEAQIKFGAISE
jgi:hypothetical protein